jgi:hypothetical protein
MNMIRFDINPAWRHLPVAVFDGWVFDSAEKALASFNRVERGHHIGCHSIGERPVSNLGAVWIGWLRDAESAEVAKESPR